MKMNGMMSLLRFRHLFLLFIAVICCNGAASPMADLPPNWSRHVEHGKEFYYNQITGASQWHHPAMPTSPAPPTISPIAQPAGPNADIQGKQYAAPRNPLHRLKKGHRYLSKDANANATRQATQPADNVESIYSLKSDNLVHGVDPIIARSSDHGSVFERIVDVGATRPSEEHAHTVIKAFDKVEESVVGSSDRSDGLIVEESAWTSEDSREQAEQEQGQEDNEAQAPHDQGQFTSEPTIPPSISEEYGRNDEIQELQQRVQELEENLVETMENSIMLEDSLAMAQISIDSSTALIQELQANATRYSKEVQAVRSLSQRQKQELLKAQRIISKLQSMVKQEREEKGVLQSELALVKETVPTATEMLDAEMAAEIVDGIDIADTVNVDNQEEGEGDEVQSPSLLSRIWTMGRKATAATQTTHRKHIAANSAIVQLSAADTAKMQENMTALHIVLTNRDQVIRELLEQLDASRSIIADSRLANSNLSNVVDDLHQQVRNLTLQLDAKTLSVLIEEANVREQVSRLSIATKEYHLLQTAYKDYIATDALVRAHYVQFVLYLLHKVNSTKVDCSDKDKVIVELTSSIHELARKKKHAEEQLHNVTTQLYQQKLHKADETAAVSVSHSKPQWKCIFASFKWW